MSKATSVRERGFTTRFGGLEVWSVAAQFVADWDWPPSVIRPLNEVLVRRRESASDTLAPDSMVTMLTIRFDGSVEPRAPVRLDDVKGQLFRVHTGDVVCSKIDVRNGAIGVVPEGMECVYVTSEFPVYAVDERKADPVFIKLLFRTAAFKRVLNSMISGTSGRKRIQPTQLEKARVPMPPLEVQRRIVMHWLDGERELVAANAAFSALVEELDAYLTERTHAFSGITRARSFVARFENTHQWDLKGGRAAAFIAANADFVRLGDCSEECTGQVRPWQQPDRLWPVYGVNNRDGVFLSAVQDGREFKAPYKRIEMGWFLHNPTRANVGSLGIVDDVPSDAITSPEYQVWRLTGAFLPEFMALVLRTDYFLALVAINRVGAVKQRMYYANLAEIHIPEVPKPVQREFAARRSRALNKIDANGKVLAEREAEIEEMILGKRTVRVP